MPKRPSIPCKHPNCPKLVAYGEKYCDEHKSLHLDEIYHKEKGTGKRLYTSRWQKASKAFLKAHPLCERCKAEGRYTKATVVDHIKPHKGDYNLFWDRNNWQSLCKQCHDKKTLTEDRKGSMSKVYEYKQS